VAGKDFSGPFSGVGMPPVLLNAHNIVSISQFVTLKAWMQLDPDNF
jgi:hypothetical protein